ncbi:MAG: hypothetical protein AAF750_15510 [Planctomycetota bacterium]
MLGQTPVTFTANEPAVTAVAHPFTLGDALGFVVPYDPDLNPTAAPPNGLDTDTTYFARPLTTDTLSLHPTATDAQDNTNALTPTDAGSPGPVGFHLETLSVLERMQRQLRQDLITATGLDPANVQFVDDDGNEPDIPDPDNTPEAWIVLAFDETDYLNHRNSPPSEFPNAANVGLVPVVIDCHLLVKPPGVRYLTWANRWNAVIKAALLTNPTRQEGGLDTVGGSNRDHLAQTAYLDGSHYQAENQSKSRSVGICGVSATIEMRHLYADPFTRV